MNILVHLADRVLNQPMLITPEKAAVIMSVLGGRIGVSAPDASRFFNESEGESGRSRPYSQTRNGVAVIPILGSLVNRGAWVGASSGLTSYEGLKFQFAEAKADSSITHVVLDIQSPGGEAVGAFETAQAVRELAAVKPVIAVVNGMAASAAYAIASAATEIVTTETGVSGSIGVVLMHADYSESMAAEGIKPTFIFAGAHKVDANPFEPLPESVRDRLQAEVNVFYEQFLATVAVGRGKRLSIEAARATEAQTFIGAQSVKLGLADRIGTFESVLSELSRAPSGRSTSPYKGAKMDENKGAPAADAGISAADLAAAVDLARAEGVASGRAAAIADVSAIMGCDEAKGREKAAFDMACDGVSLTLAKKLLAGQPKGSSLAARMAADPVPAIGGGEGAKVEKTGGLAAAVDKQIAAARR